MLSLPTKLLFALAGLALVGAAGYGVSVGERAGIGIFLSLAVAASVAGLAMLVARDDEPFVAPDAPPPDPRATTPGAAARGSIFPLLTALAVGVVAVGAAVGAPLVALGIGLTVVVGMGWFGRAWSEHPNWTPRVRERVDYRFLVPASLPILMLLLVLALAASFSRVLLAVDKDLATVIAMVVAIALVAVFAVFALKPRVSPRVLSATAVVGAIATFGAGVAGAAQGERHFEHHGHAVPEVHVTAKDTAFAEAELVVPGNAEKVKIDFTNSDPGIYHNVAIYDGVDADAKPLFNGVGFTGIDNQTYELKPPPPGTYIFVCDFHVNMRGQFVVE
ncbi:MAG TPA: cupredoxin domain-containing protein [Acidimicrobiales bacterium]|nr:cupredoxin domain-containing protein [Acidimicrobiales bacterium]